MSDCADAQTIVTYMSAYVRRPLFSWRGNRPSRLSHKNEKGDNSNLLDYNRDCMATVGLKIRLEAMENGPNNKWRFLLNVKIESEFMYSFSKEYSA